MTNSNDNNKSVQNSDELPLWQEIVEKAASQIVEAVRITREEYPDQHIYGAMFHEFYGDGSVIYWPNMTIGTEETLAQVKESYIASYGDSDDLEESLRWSGPDLIHSFDSGEEEQSLADQVQAIATQSGGGFKEWEREYERFMHCFPKAAMLASKQLIADGIVNQNFIAIADDEEGDLIPLSLTKAQLLQHFPSYSEAEKERARLLALPVEQRVAELLPEAVTPRFQGPLIGEYSQLLVNCGSAALPALARVVRGEQLPQGKTTAAMLLAEINMDTPEVIDALHQLMLTKKADMNARSWAASALARMDRSDLILAHVPELPVEVVTRGISGPLRSFRDNGAHRPLDYTPLDAVLSQYPALETAFNEELKLGVGFCSLKPDEIPTARAALASPWLVIRRHAAEILDFADVKASS